MKHTCLADPDFLLTNTRAVELYHRYAEGMPIVDYHCHLPPGQLAADHRFADLTEIWLAGDHYKWRAMRTNGVAERFCTGDATSREKFQQWAETVPHTLRNPLHHWTHLELKKPFGITDRFLDGASAQYVWEACNARLAQPGFTCRGLAQQWEVRVICTTDDPADDLAAHRRMAADPACKVKVFPAFRPDASLGIENPAVWNAYIDRLAASADVEIGNYTQLFHALHKRMDYFQELGCSVSDHGLEQLYAADFTHEQADRIVADARAGKTVSPGDALLFKSALLHDLGAAYAKRGWVQQFHLGALRGNNTRMRKLLGADTGHDSIGDFEQARPLSRFMDRLDQENRLAKTILYNLNPRDNEVMATMAGNFQDGSVAGKIQYGSAWWFLDQKDGMEKQIDALSNLGLLSRFVGMLTDSRSFLSYSRHEYFRRILCNKLGVEMAKGEIPDDLALLGNMIQDICYRNAVNYFGWQDKV